jgi:hypothetical protein
VTRDEFVAWAEEEGIDERAYSIDGGDDNERYSLAWEGSGWSVYYSERGMHRQSHTFAFEAEAWDELLARLLKDPTTRVGER